MRNKIKKFKLHSKCLNRSSENSESTNADVMHACMHGTTDSVAGVELNCIFSVDDKNNCAWQEF